MNEMISVAAFLKRRIKTVGAWPTYSRRFRERMLMWLAWHTARYNACVVKDGNKIMAVGIARTIINEIDAREPFKNDECGKICFVEHTASLNNEGFKTLLNYVQKRWAHCDKIMFSRSKNGSKMKAHDMKTFMRKAGL